MGVRSWLRETFRRTPAAEVAEAVGDAPTARQVRRAGYEYGMPLSGVTSSQQVAATSERQQILNQLHQAYLTCPWVSAPIDTISRTVTAGGLQIVSDSQVPEGQVPPEPPPVQRLRRLMRFVNPREDMVQLLRNCATDLELFGDCYIEIVTLLGEPIALYTLDATTMTVIADQHGEVTGYRQDVDGVRNATFEPDEVIHISLDAPRGGLYGVSPAQKALLPVTGWLFWEATLKECGRRGDPPRIHVDLGHFSDTDVQRWREQYHVNNLGPKAVGTPVITTGGGGVQVIDPRKVTDFLDVTRQLRDEILSVFGVPPSKVGVIETGNLGGGTGEAQNKTFQINTIIPIAALILEKLNYHLLQVGFGITDYHLEFAEIDFRDSEVVEKIRDMRLKNGSYSLNRYRDEIGEPPVDGGDVPILVERSYMMTWPDAELMSQANIIYRAKASSTGTIQQTMADQMGLGPQVPAMAAAGAFLPYAPDGMQPPPAPAPQPPDVPDAMRDPEDGPGLDKDAAQGKGPREHLLGRDQRLLTESWNKAYRARRRQALKDLPDRDREKVPV